LLQGVAVLIAAAFVYGTMLAGSSVARSRAAAFATLVLGNVGLILSNRSQTETVWTSLRRPNAALWWVIAGAIGGLLLALYVPPFARLFSFEPLAVRDLALATVAGSAGILGSEVVKYLSAASRRDELARANPTR
jgi:Ca2+-transporting ATPase